MRAWALAAVIGGAPSTAHALLTGRDPLAATRAAGAILGRPGVAAGVAAHVLISAWWTLVLAAAHRRRPLGAASGAVAGLLIAALDLGVLAPAEIRALPQWPQWLDHVVFGAVAGATLSGLGERPPNHTSGR
ncbi:hypothetical protein FKR81_34955 [Lentzea tibetensis]|uniref:Uncharacterized protein n=1 Tax=Lentzea tibetensis TaxID=2591470 RepID=A0A563EJ90_9PSEU|nr:hypothetical protein FKR81_34955 [Lentzea tibetensis]